MAGSDRDPWPARLAFIATSAALATVLWGAVTAADRPPAPSAAPADALPAAAGVRAFGGSESDDDRDHERARGRASDRQRESDPGDDRTGHDADDDESDDDDEDEDEDDDERRPSAPALRTRGS